MVDETELTLLRTDTVTARPGMLARVQGLSKLFLLCVVLPTTIAATYYGLFASDVYISEARFVVRSPQRQAQTGIVGALLQGSGFSNAQDDTYLVHDYVLSRDALADLNKDGTLVKSYSHRGADLFSRFPLLNLDPSFEALWRYYQKHIDVDYDATSGITTLRVRAFTSDDAHRINEDLMTLSERLINNLNARATQDMIGFAQSDSLEAELAVRKAALAMSKYRDTNTVFDPEKQSALQLQQVSALQSELVAAKTQLIEVQSVSPANPQVAALRTRVGVLQDEIDRAVKNVVGNKSSLAGKAPDYERLVLDKAFAERRFASAITALETAQSEAQRKQLYLERLVQPNEPDVAVEPKRLQSVFVVFILGLIVWGLLKLLIGGIREHQL